MQQCTKCNNIKPVADFNKCASKKGGYSYHCRTCTKQVFKNFVPKEKIVVENGYKFCNTCSVIKTTDNFVKNAQGKDGFYSRCRSCCADRSRVERNKPENKVKLKEAAAKYTRDNRAAANVKSANRRAMRNKATPPWAADEFEVFFLQEIYKLSSLRESATGFKWHVDHIIPLLNPEVCGLHCSSNLQLIPAFQNLSKGNKFIGELNGN